MLAGSFGSQLGLGGLANVTWAARWGMRWGQFLPVLFDYLQLHPLPQVIMVHLGENILGQRMSMSLRLQARREFSLLRLWFPGIVILWSNLLPRRIWRGARSVRRIDVTRKRVNAYLGRVVVEQGEAVIQHPAIGFRQPALFHSDGVHLSPTGNDLFLADLQKGLKDFLLAGSSEDKR